MRGLTLSGASLFVYGITLGMSNHKAILGFMGLVMCPKCHGSGHIIVPPYDPYTCAECMGTGKIAKQFTLEELHNELNEISLGETLLERK